MSTFGHSIFTTWPVDSLIFAVRKYKFFKRILECQDIGSFYRKNNDEKKVKKKSYLLPLIFFEHVTPLRRVVGRCVDI